VAGFVQEPSKDIVEVRELFTTRVCLGVTAASHVDMVLGEGARDRGALADEIPLDEELRSGRWLWRSDSGGVRLWASPGMTLT
jgi:hypothetical protein